MGKNFRLWRCCNKGKENVRVVVIIECLGL